MQCDEDMKHAKLVHTDVQCDQTIVSVHSRFACPVQSKDSAVVRGINESQSGRAKHFPNFLIVSLSAGLFIAITFSFCTLVLLVLRRDAKVMEVNIVTEDEMFECFDVPASQTDLGV